MTVFTVLTKTTAARILVRNPERVVWGAVNISDTDAYYGHGPYVTTSGRTKGWLIPGSNGSVEDEFWKGDIYLISGTAGKEVTFEETSKREE